jgi:hypothetical protein
MFTSSYLAGVRQATAGFQLGPLTALKVKTMSMIGIDCLERRNRCHCIPHKCGNGLSLNTHLPMTSKSYQSLLWGTSRELNHSSGTGASTGTILHGVNEVFQSNRNDVMEFEGIWGPQKHQQCPVN